VFGCAIIQRGVHVKKGASPPPPIAYPLFATKAREVVNLLMVDAGSFKSLSGSAPLTVKDLQSCCWAL
jgi:hypothetical protein